MNETENFENARYLYREADVYTPYTSKKPKLHEMGYFTDNMRAFDKLNLHYVYGELTDYNADNMRAFDKLNLHYVYGELTDYNEDGKGQYYIDGDIDDDDEYYEGRYRCEGADYVDSWLDEVSLDGNYAFYIPENSIPQEKREWYRSHAINVR